MADKFPSLGNFNIPDTLIDVHEWMIDSLIDDVTGQDCTLVFPPKKEPCDNCDLDYSTGKSSNIYNGTGPISFTNHSLCPRCGGLGQLTNPSTSNIRLRVYWDNRSWIKIGVSLAVPDSSCMTIGYLSDLPELERAKKILLPADIQNVKRWEMTRAGEAVPHGFRQDRYFIQFLERVGSGG